MNIFTNKLENVNDSTQGKVYKYEKKLTNKCNWGKTKQYIVSRT
jgi:hypothetical protein